MELIALARAAARGDRDAAEALVRATLLDVWRFCRSMTGPERADDAVQDTYLRAWQSLPTCPPDRDATSWLMTIAWRASTDQLRAEHRHRRRLERLRSQPSPAPALSADSKARTLSDDLLAGLDPDRRAAFVLTQILGYSYAEVAATCDVSIGTIRSRVARARTDLSHAIDEHQARRSV